MYVKCATPDVAVAASRTMQGRWFAGKSRKLSWSVYKRIAVIGTHLSLLFSFALCILILFNKITSSKFL